MYNIDNGAPLGFHARPNASRPAVQPRRAPKRRQGLTTLQTLGVLAFVLTIASLGIGACLFGLGYFDRSSVGGGWTKGSDAADGASSRQVHVKKAVPALDGPALEESTILTMLEAIQHPLTVNAVRFRFAISDIPSPRISPPSDQPPAQQQQPVTLAAMPALPSCDFTPEDPSIAIIEFSAKLVKAGSPELAMAEGVIRALASGSVDDSPIARLRNRRVLELGASVESGAESHLAFDVESGSLYVADAASWEDPRGPTVIGNTAARGCFERITWLRTVGREPVVTFDAPAYVQAASVAYLGT